MINKGAIIDPSCEIADSAEIAAGAYIGKNCVIGENVQIGYNAVVESNTTIGDGTVLSPNAHIGGAPQDYSFRGEDTKLIIGKNCVIREFATIHRASTKEDVWETVVGDDCFIMAYAHIGHDCKLGNNITLTNYVSFGGHCHVGSNVVAGGYAGCHQFTRIGTGAMLGARVNVSKDIPPFCMAVGIPARIEGLNVVGLKRRGVKPDARLELKRAMAILRDLKIKLADVPDKLAELEQFEEVKIFIDFLKDSKRGFTRR
ncbi:acyl-(acyl-carrier-protein)--UDP-N-acetylglucosamine O-acyltransferase [Denitrovibrio acetiphilus DSM 12809]|uniref:Acyl-(Acyl-carrier-protein)--UDP-N-acetylglucosamine O-acyltransferase n=1 Tax=Denitrovibrio acetiphilus (strain DSM 12809 / NBRC 114555 / N2460) TaxID=522772 RepID=D4H331_DENA2|nr:acyl-ACP--UDP-N-acetylglucosamine O-acyltransferase [Denitrovibrio acetiphilus]ADD69054.1 acyl-(acyl-carrier-protein)--UDP-N-acetylglucosamine O-acyltransferase [Denitrovibrio acetiphilus DSM 12809]